MGKYNVHKVEGRIEKLLFYKDGFAIFKMHDGQTSFSVKGKIDQAYLKVGRQLSFEGDWTHHPKYGPGFQLKAPYKPQVGDCIDSGNLRFLSSLPHISEARAKILMQRHGTKVFNMLWKNPDEALQGLPGLTQPKKEEIKEWLEDNKPSLGFELVLHRLGYGENMRDKIKSDFKPGMAKAIRDNPYLLLRVNGIGFHSLDKKVLEGKLLTQDSEVRVNACVIHALDQASMAGGHTLLPEQSIIQACKKLGVRDVPLIQKAIKTNLDEAVIEELDGAYGSHELLEQERQIAKSLLQLAGGKLKEVKGINVEGLDPDQAEAVKTMLNQPVSFLTGGPGTGKTFTVNIALKNLMDNSLGTFTLCAPTGKAAKRMTEATGMPAQTIHRMLINNTIGDTVIVDECSMLSTELASELTNFLWQKGCRRLILVGDPDQLPSIAPGRVFDDLLDTGLFPVSRLTKVRRQAQDSNIVMNATRIRDGESITVDNTSDFKTSFIPLDRQEEALMTAFTTRIPQLKKSDGSALDPMNDVQVIVPQHKGDLGCSRLNVLLQEALNPGMSSNTWKFNYGDLEFAYREGDKIIVTKNSREYNLVNGDIGIVKRLGQDTMSVEFERENGTQEVNLSRDFLNNVRPGYAITVHRAQGSEAPMVIVLYNEQTPPMFRQRNMLYTAVTRARENLWLIGSEKVVEDAIANNAPSQRKTGLIAQTQQLYEQLPLTHPLRMQAQPEISP